MKEGAPAWKMRCVEEVEVWDDQQGAFIAVRPRGQQALFIVPFVEKVWVPKWGLRGDWTHLDGHDGRDRWIQWDRWDRWIR